MKLTKINGKKIMCSDNEVKIVVIDHDNKIQFFNKVTISQLTQIMRIYFDFDLWIENL